jgi:hypothetical protein
MIRQVQREIQIAYQDAVPQKDLFTSRVGSPDCRVEKAKVMKVCSRGSQILRRTKFFRFCPVLLDALIRPDKYLTSS